MVKIPPIANLQPISQHRFARWLMGCDSVTVRLLALRHRLTATIRKYPSQNFVFLVYLGWSELIMGKFKGYHRRHGLTREPSFLRFDSL